MDTIQKWTLGVGLLGAAAWIPHFVQYVIMLRKKPSLILSPPSTCSIGFTELGPVLNIQVALTSSVKDILIDNIELTVEHETGSKVDFQWHEFVETKGQVMQQGTVAQEFVQFSEAIAVKVLTTDFKDLLLRTRLRSHSDKFATLHDAFLRKKSTQIAIGNYDSGTFFSSTEAQNLLSFIQSQMSWIKGKYTVSFNLRDLNDANIDTPVLGFELDDQDIILLQANCSNLQVMVRNACNESPQQNTQVDFVWRTKKITVSK